MLCRFVLLALFAMGVSGQISCEDAPPRYCSGVLCDSPPTCWDSCAECDENDQCTYTKTLAPGTDCVADGTDGICAGGSCVLPIDGGTASHSINVTVSLYSDSACTQYVESITYPMGKCNFWTGACEVSCHGWTREVLGGDDHSDSARLFNCYRDWGIIYSQWVESIDCGETESDTSNQRFEKEARIGCCLPEPSGELYSMILEDQREAIDACPPRHNNLPTEDDCTEYLHYNISVARAETEAEEAAACQASCDAQCGEGGGDGGGDGAGCVCEDSIEFDSAEDWWQFLMGSAVGIICLLGGQHVLAMRARKRRRLAKRFGEGIDQALMPQGNNPSEEVNIFADTENEVSLF